MDNAYIYMKVQTTGGKERDLVELGGIVEYNGRIVKDFNFVIRPEELIKSKASQLHGIYMVSNLM